MRFVRVCLASALLVLTACGARAEDAAQSAKPARLTPEQVQHQYELALAAAQKLPPAMRDLPFTAGVEGNDEVHGKVLTFIVGNAVRARDFASLDQMEAYLVKARSRLPGGTWELDTYHRALDHAWDKPANASAPCELAGIDFVKAWQASNPQEPAAYITEAALRLDHAWCIRGSGFANTVAPDVWAPFRENVDAAYKALAAHADVAKQNPEYYALMERIFTAQERSAPEFRRLLDEGSARAPYYYAIYFNAASQARPQWRGSGAEVDRIARYAMAHTSKDDGAGAYARVYWDLSDCGCDLNEYPIDHKLIARAMDDIMARTPSHFNAAHFAMLACRLGERELAAKQFARGGQDPMDWDDQQELQRCLEFAGLN